MDDHWFAWRQTHEAGGAPRPGSGALREGPFSFCSFPFLLSPRAKSRLLHTEARALMAQTVQQVSPSPDPVAATRPPSPPSARSVPRFAHPTLQSTSWECFLSARLSIHVCVCRCETDLSGSSCTRGPWV